MASAAPPAKKAKAGAAPTESLPHPLSIERPLGAHLETSGGGTPGTRAATILESGRIIFLARPTIAASEDSSEKKMTSSADIRTFYMALVPAPKAQTAAESPSEKEEEEEGKADKEQKAAAAAAAAAPPAHDGGEWAPNSRLLVVGRKSLPTSKGEKYWAFVQSRSDTCKFSDLFQAESGPATTTTDAGAGAAKNKRKAPPGGADDRLRVLGEGDYALTRVGKNVSTGRLTYVLSEPHHPDAAPALAEVGVQPAGRFVISVKNVDSASGKAMGLSRAAKAHFPPAALAAFKGKTARTAAHGLAWANFSASPLLLNTRHCECLFMPANAPVVADPALASSLAAAADADHKAHLQAATAAAAGGGGGGEAGAVKTEEGEEGEEGGEEEEEHVEHDEEEAAAVRAALEEELQAAALHLDVVPAVTGELE